LSFCCSFEKWKFRYCRGRTTARWKGQRRPERTKNNDDDDDDDDDDDEAETIELKKETALMKWVLIFTSDPKIIYYIVQLSPILYPTVAIFATGDQMLAILLGQGRSKIKMYLSLFSLWGITFPLAYYLFFFVGRELPEIWSSFSVGYIVLEVVAAYFVYYSDWEAVFHRAKQYANRMKEKNFA
jgi:hypothetical protein